MEIDKLNKIADWILNLPKDEQFKISPLDFLKLSNMLEKYKSEQLNLPDVIVPKGTFCERRLAWNNCEIWTKSNRCDKTCKYLKQNAL